MLEGASCKDSLNTRVGLEMRMFGRCARPPLAPYTHGLIPVDTSQHTPHTRARTHTVPCGTVFFSPLEMSPWSSSHLKYDHSRPAKAPRRFQCRAASSRAASRGPRWAEKGPRAPVAERRRAAVGPSGQLCPGAQVWWHMPSARSSPGPNRGRRGLPCPCPAALPTQLSLWLHRLSLLLIWTKDFVTAFVCLF